MRGRRRAGAGVGGRLGREGAVRGTHSCAGPMFMPAIMSIRLPSTSRHACTFDHERYFARKVVSTCQTMYMHMKGASAWNTPTPKPMHGYACATPPA